MKYLKIGLDTEGLINNNLNIYYVKEGKLVPYEYYDDIYITDTPLEGEVELHNCSGSLLTFDKNYSDVTPRNLHNAIFTAIIGSF